MVTGAINKNKNKQIKNKIVRVLSVILYLYNIQLTNLNQCDRFSYQRDSSF